MVATSRLYAEQSSWLTPSGLSTGLSIKTRSVRFAPLPFSSTSHSTKPLDWATLSAISRTLSSANAMLEPELRINRTTGHVALPTRGSPNRPDGCLPSPKTQMDREMNQERGPHGPPLLSTGPTQGHGRITP